MICFTQTPSRRAKPILPVGYRHLLPDFSLEWLVLENWRASGARGLESGRKSCDKMWTNGAERGGNPGFLRCSGRRGRRFKSCCPDHRIPQSFQCFDCLFWHLTWVSKLCNWRAIGAQNDFLWNGEENCVICFKGYLWNTYSWDWLYLLHPVLFSKGVELIKWILNFHFHLEPRTPPSSLEQYLHA